MTFRTKISGQKNWLPRTDSQSTGAACHLETIRSAYGKFIRTPAAHIKTKKPLKRGFFGVVYLHIRMLTQKFEGEKRKGQSEIYVKRCEPGTPNGEPGSPNNN